MYSAFNISHDFVKHREYADKSSYIVDNVFFHRKLWYNLRMSTQEQEHAPTSTRRHFVRAAVYGGIAYGLFSAEEWGRERYHESDPHRDEVLGNVLKKYEIPSAQALEEATIINATAHAEIEVLALNGNLEDFPVIYTNEQIEKSAELIAKANGTKFENEYSLADNDEWNRKAGSGFIAVASAISGVGFAIGVVKNLKRGSTNIARRIADKINSRSSNQAEA